MASLDHEQLLVKNARLPKMPGSEVLEAVRWEAAERFPFDPGNGQLKYLLAGDVRQGGEIRQEVLLFAASEQTLREQLKMLTQAGCQPVGLDARPLALARAGNHFCPAVVTGDEMPVRVLADLGGHSCQVVILRGELILFIKTIEIGSGDLTRAVAEKVGTSLDDTVALRMRLGGPDLADGPADDDPAGEGSKIHRAVVAAMRPVIERLAREISLCLRYYSVTFRGHRPDCITFVGGGCHDRLVIELLTEALGIEVRVGRPVADCRPAPDTCRWGVGPEAGGPEWAVAFGCCLKPLAQGRDGPGAGAPADSDLSEMTSEPADGPAPEVHSLEAMVSAAVNDRPGPPASGWTP